MKTAPSIAILKPGTFTDMRGTRVTFTRADLAQVAASYDAVSDPAPLVIGHPSIDAPAYGWVDRIELHADDVLRAYPSNIAPAFAEAVEAKHYRKVSPQLYPPRAAGNPKPGYWYLQHVGFLGGAAPAIKGLGTVSLAQVDKRDAIAIAIDQSAPVVSFSAPAGYAVDERHGELWQRARALHDADPALPFWEAFERVRYEAAIVSLAEEPAGDHGNRLMIRARAIRATDPRLTFWDAFTRARAEAA